MSEQDSFIDEVTEEVRRDRLFALFRKYGWIAVLAVLGIVGAAAYSEWNKARATAAAQARGDAMLLALRAETPADRLAGLDAIEAGGDSDALVRFLRATQQLEAGDTAAAAATLLALADDGALGDIYRHAAVLKLVSLPETAAPDPAERIALLEPVAAPGQPYSGLAREQLALAELGAGNRERALEILQELTVAADVTAGLRQRAQQLIVALGGTVEQG